MTATPTQRRLIGSDPNQIPLNGMLGRMAFLDPENLPAIPEAEITNAEITNAEITNAEITNAEITNAEITTGTYGLASGTESAPALFFAEDVDLGVYRAAPNTWGFVAGGLTQVKISDALAPLEERYDTAFHPVVTGVDIGDAPDQISPNWSLGLLAFLDQLDSFRPSASTPLNNLDINFEYVSDTSLRIRMRGADGVVRSVTLTLA
jgi:hypothetical protein